MFSWLKKTPRSSRILGLEMRADGCVLAIVDQTESTGVVITAVRRLRFRESSDQASMLRRALRELHARGLPVVATLAQSAYLLVQLEAPDLEADELREAMRWRVKDLIDFPLADAVIDVFKLPASRRAGAPELVYVVVARSEAVEQLATLLHEVGLDIRAIDIAEMAIRNLVLHLDKPGRPRAYLHMQHGQTLIEIADGAQIYLSRRVLQDYDADADMVLLQAQMENLALEVQRSLDYFESQYALGAADQLSVIVCDDELFSAFNSVARTFLTVNTERFSLSAISAADSVDVAELERGVTALGAALRDISWAA